MLDIDYFKNYNDKFGHTAGDTVLKILSQNITELLKDLSPVISRFGGEEFCIILPNIEKKKAFSIAQKLRERIGKEKIILRRLETNVTVSIGVVTFPVDTADEIELLQKADRLMYQAKEKGRNRACCI
jgi:diguanylate cyclase (GGDEF)-like protein